LPSVLGVTGLGVNTFVTSLRWREPFPLGIPLGNVNDDILNPKATKPSLCFLAGAHVAMLRLDIVLDNPKGPAITNQLVHGISDRGQPLTYVGGVLPNVFAGGFAVIKLELRQKEEMDCNIDI